MEKQIIIELEVKSEQAAKNLEEARVLVEKLKLERKDLQKQLKENTITEDEYAKKMADNVKNMQSANSAIKANTKAINDNAKTINAEIKSLDQKRGVLSEMIKQYDALSESERESAKGTDLLKSIQTLTAEVSTLEEATGRHQRSVGNYTKAMDALPQPIKSVVVGFQGLGTTLKALVANPIVAMIAAIVLVLQRLVEAFKRSDNAMTDLETAFATFQPIITAVRFVLDKVVETIAKIAITAANAATSVLSLIPAFRKSKEAAQENVIALDRLEDKEREYIVKSAERSRDVSKLRNNATQTEKYTAEQRVKFLKNAYDLEVKDLEDRKKIAEEKYRLEKKKVEQSKDTTDETKNNLARLYAESIKAEEEFYSGTRRLMSQLNTAQKEIAAEEEQRAKAAAERAKAAAERRKAILATQIEIERQYQDLILQALDEGQEKEISLAKIANQRKIEEIKKRLKEDKTLNKKSRENLNAIIIQLEAQLAIQIADIQKKYRDKAEEDEEKSRKAAEAEKIESLKNEIEEEYKYQKKAFDDTLELVKNNLLQRYDLEISATRQRLDTLQSMDEEHYLAMYGNYEKYADEVKNTQIYLSNLETERLKAPYMLAAGYADAAGAISSSMKELFNNIGEDGAKLQAFQKALALTDIAISTAKALAEAISAGAGIPFPGNLPAIASGTAAVISGIAQAMAIIKKTSETSVPTFSEGGRVVGAGTETSDSINARLSNGEYVLSAKTTRAIGADNLDIINFGYNKKNIMKTSFADGGLVNAPNFEAVKNTISMTALRDIQPVVSVKEITRVANRVKVKESISKN